MKSLPVVTLLMLAPLIGNNALAAESPSLSAGAKVFIQPMGGLETYLLAAMEKTRVPVTIVSDQALADFVMTQNSAQSNRELENIAFPADRSDRQSAVVLLSADTREQTFACPVRKSKTSREQQTAAEACAKQMKTQIEKGP